MELIIHVSSLSTSQLPGTMEATIQPDLHAADPEYLTALGVIFQTCTGHIQTTKLLATSCIFIHSCRCCRMRCRCLPQAASVSPAGTSCLCALRVTQRGGRQQQHCWGTPGWRRRCQSTSGGCWGCWGSWHTTQMTGIVKV
jgi:hypothetical protein